MTNTSTKSKRSTTSLKAKIDDYEKKIYDLTQLLGISKSLCSVLDYSTLVESILYICMCQMRVLGAGIFVCEDFESDIYSLEDYYSGLDTDPLISYSLSTSNPLIQFLTKEERPFTMEELFSAMGEQDIPEITSLNPSLIVPLKQKNHLIGILLLGERIDLGEGIDFSVYERNQIQSIASLAAIAIGNANLVEMTTTDMMTHLKLKHYFFNVLADKIDVSVSQHTPISVLMMDIDHFKNFNDTYGHACGDYVLQEVAHVISEGIRTHDLAGRYGGEEFVVMLYNTESTTAMMVAERIRKAIEKKDFEYEGKKFNVTISIGAAVLQKNEFLSAKQLVDNADQALYVSKNSGRNRVSLFDGETA